MPPPPGVDRKTISAERAHSEPLCKSEDGFGDIRRVCQKSRNFGAHRKDPDGRKKGKQLVDKPEVEQSDRRSERLGEAVFGIGYQTVERIRVTACRDNSDGGASYVANHVEHTGCPAEVHQLYKFNGRGKKESETQSEKNPDGALGNALERHKGKCPERKIHEDIDAYVARRSAIEPGRPGMPELVQSGGRERVELEWVQTSV